MMVNMQSCMSYTTSLQHVRGDGSTRYCQLISVEVCLQRIYIYIHLEAVKLHTHPIPVLQNL